VPIVLKSGGLNLLEPSGPVQTCNGIALPFLHIAYSDSQRSYVFILYVYLMSPNYSFVKFVSAHVSFLVLVPAFLK